MVITSQARQGLIRQLYLNTRSGGAFGQQRGRTLQVQCFAASHVRWADPLLEFPLNWRGRWCASEDQGQLQLRTDLILTAGWDRAGTLIVRARTVGGEIPVYIV